MVKLTGQPGDFRRQSFRGAAYITVSNGVVSMKAWPRKRKRPLDPVTQENNEKFRQASMATKVMSGDQINMARRLTVGTNALPRDILIQTLYGRTGTFILRDGKALYSMATKADMDLLLDVFGDTPGSILYRTTDDWVGLLPGDPGEVLKLDAEGFPGWAEEGGGGGGGFSGASFGTFGAISTAARASKGTFFTANRACSITGIRALMNFTLSNDTYSAQLVKLSAASETAEVTEVLATSPTKQDSQTYATGEQFLFAAPVEIVQGDVIGCLLNIRGEGDTAASHLAFDSADERALIADGPFETFPHSIQYEKELVSVGNTPDSTGTSIYRIWPVGQ